MTVYGFNNRRTAEIVAATARRNPTNSRGGAIDERRAEYIAKVPAGGLPPLNGDVPGKAICEIYYYNGSDLEPERDPDGNTVTREVLNLGSLNIPGNAYVPAVALFENYLAASSSGGAGGSTDACCALIESCPELFTAVDTEALNCEPERRCCEPISTEPACAFEAEAITEFTSSDGYSQTGDSLWFEDDDGCTWKVPVEKEGTGAGTIKIERIGVDWFLSFSTDDQTYDQVARVSDSGDCRGTKDFFQTGPDDWNGTFMVQGEPDCCLSLGPPTISLTISQFQDCTDTGTQTCEVDPGTPQTRAYSAWNGTYTFKPTKDEWELNGVYSEVTNIPLPTTCISPPNNKACDNPDLKMQILAQMICTAGELTTSVSVNFIDGNPGLGVTGFDLTVAGNAGGEDQTPVGTRGPGCCEELVAGFTYQLNSQDIAATMVTTRGNDAAPAGFSFTHEDPDYTGLGFAFKLAHPELFQGSGCSCSDAIGIMNYRSLGGINSRFNLLVSLLAKLPADVPEVTQKLRAWIDAQ